MISRSLRSFFLIFPVLLWSLSSHLRAGERESVILSGEYLPLDKEKWEYAYSDSENRPDAGEFRSVTRLWNPAGHDGKPFLWLKARLSHFDDAVTVIYLHAIDKVFDVYVDGELVYQYGGHQSGKITSFPGYRITMFDYGKPLTGKLLEFRIVSDVGNIGIVPPAYLLTKRQSGSILFIKSVANIALACFNLNMGFFVFVYWIFFRRRLDLPYFALLALFSAFYIILRSPLANYYRGPFTYIMADTSWFVFMASAMAFLRHKFNIHNWSMRVFNFVFAYIPVFIMLALIKPLYYSNLVLPVQIMVLLIPFILVGNIFYYLNTLNKVEGIIVLITALIITVSSSVDVLGAINVIDRLDVDLGVYSLFIMAVCFAFLLCFDFLSFNATLSLEKSRYELEKSQMAHLEAEFKKMVEGWQFEKIKNGLTLEHSMPVQRNEACILNFQLLTAHGAGLGDEQIFFQTLLKKCRELVHEAAQDAVQEGAKGYSLKVSGYGFLVSVGFPLPCGSDIFENALRLAESFVGAFKKTTEELAPPQKLSCAVAVTYGQVTGYFPALGMRFYDLYGEPVVNAHHFHTLRSIFVAEKKMPHEPAIIVQHAVFEKLPSELKTAFAKLALAASSPGVGNAERFFYFRPA